MTRFVVPEASEATSPPEWRGFDRDDVRLLVATPSRRALTRFRDLPRWLEPGDLLVVNTSGTLPAAVDGQYRGRTLPVHIAGELEDGDWVVELRRPDGMGWQDDAAPGEHVQLPGGVLLKLTWPYPDMNALKSRLWRASTTPEMRRIDYLCAYGRPITYGYVTENFPLSAYQTVYATEPGSAEMPSAGRPFTHEILVRLMARGVTVAPVLLHSGVSSPEAHEPPIPEQYAVPESTARLAAMTRANGHRVIAVGTTVVRALESAVVDGVARPAQGWTDLILGPHRPAHVVSGLITGLHDPDSSHLQLLEAVAGKELVDAAYTAAVEHRMLWHEFGDSMVLLP
ncbi:S-adenosylmethionine:tRNA ribosyltransferase-isomerase [Thermocrispum municipale]|jgi:S-adenosylmethionine:tRNA ribosyltransferase-isomerase|uniref:S-adenosylmethionine:tRNA ribosyltransferase-isomerase n=1 Tax=Thermocrispum municipale TaxID=37926 RepID=UPI00042841BE|nr:S-adenosylmethionine:tRNA ribosyltransferase-isomerase [Thermocrispum municipale]